MRSIPFFFLVLILLPSIFADVAWLRGEGEGITKNAAISNAIHNTFLDYLEESMSGEKFGNARPQIESFLIENWQLYTRRDWQDYTRIRRIGEQFYLARVRLRVKTRQLLEDLTKAVRPQIQIALMLDEEYPRELDREVMFATLENILSQKLAVVDLYQLQKSLADKGASIAEVQQQVAGIIRVYLWCETKAQRSPIGDGKLWRATIGTRGVDGSQVLWNARVSTGGKIQAVESSFMGDEKARRKAIENVAKAVAHKILRTLDEKYEPTAQILTIKLKGFTRGELHSFRNALLGMERAGYSKVVQPGTREFRLEWRRGNIAKATTILREFCENNDIVVASRVVGNRIYLEPLDDERYWDEDTGF